MDLIKIKERTLQIISSIINSKKFENVPHTLVVDKRAEFRSVIMLPFYVSQK